MMEQQLLDRISDIVNAPATDRQKVDGLLELDARLYTELGIDSTKADKLETRRKSRIIYREIRSIDKKDGNLLLNHLDK
tara:strand:+ start:291 stop:527 length:237 start_codon:yes stop_codon:yes gene_type:complete